MVWKRFNNWYGEIQDESWEISDDIVKFNENRWKLNPNAIQVTNAKKFRKALVEEIESDKMAENRWHKHLFLLYY